MNSDQEKEATLIILFPAIMLGIFLGCLIAYIIMGLSGEPL